VKQIVDLSAGLACPIPLTEYKSVLMAHGGGGKLTQQLIQKMFVSQFDNDMLGALHDGAVFQAGNMKLAFSTDSYVINPIFFPGGTSASWR
jgi:hydrogenase expression/formation protein HypE